MNAPLFLAFKFLKKAQTRDEILQQLLDQAEESRRFRDWRDLAHRERSDTPEEERKYPSLRHVPTQKEKEERERAFDRDTDKELQYNLERIDRTNELAAESASKFLRNEIGSSINDFRNSPEGQSMLNELINQQKQNKINEIIGMPRIPSRDISTSMPTKDRVLVEALKTGDTSTLDRLQQRQTGPLVGDMPLEEYEKTYPVQESSQTHDPFDYPRTPEITPPPIDESEERDVSEMWKKLGSLFG